MTAGTDTGAGAGGADEGADAPAVASALAELARLDGLPVDAHAEVYERVHQRLQDAMVDADQA